MQKKGRIRFKKLKRVRVGSFHEKMVGREGLEPTTIGLKVRNSVIKRLIIQPLTGTPVAAYAQPCTTDSRKTHALHYPHCVTRPGFHSFLKYRAHLRPI